MPSSASTGAVNPPEAGAGFGLAAAGSTGLTGSAVRGGFSGEGVGLGVGVGAGAGVAAGGGGTGGFGVTGAAVIRRVSRWPGKIRSGSLPTVARLVS